MNPLIWDYCVYCIRDLPFEALKDLLLDQALTVSMRFHRSSRSQRRVRACSACWISRAVSGSACSQMLPVHLDLGVANDSIGPSCSDSGAADFNHRLTGLCPEEPLFFFVPAGTALVSMSESHNQGPGQAGHTGGRFKYYPPLFPSRKHLGAGRHRLTCRAKAKPKESLRSAEKPPVLMVLMLAVTKWPHMLFL